ncbi:hypothetical protein BDZ45DRAFT_268686 [Acephala macrosclerotiorum]|nr:hypothetical protein BDZ45DRAFT_268686 [Acephala macrosclerotiorum]
MDSQQADIMGGKKTGSANLTTSLPEPLTTFPLFPQFPIDLRLYIYRIATPYERFVHLEAIFDDTDSGDDEEDPEEWQQPSDENSRNAQALDRVLQEYLMDNKERGMHFFSNRGQAQLERYGFTSSHPRPELLGDAQLKLDSLRSFLMKRRVTIWSPNPIPALLHVCRESRDYLRRSLGYELAFPTSTSPAATWFNFRDDVLFLEPLISDDIIELNELAKSGISDGGCWHLGQCGESLERIKKLAVPVPEGYLYSKKIPFNVHEIVQQCGNLQELCFVTNAWYDWYQSNHISWSWKRNKSVRLHMGSSPEQWPVRVEVALEEMWGQRLPLCQWEDDWQAFPEGTLSNELAEGIEKQIQSHSPVLHPAVDEKFRRESWTTPKVTFGVVIAQEALELFLKKRHRFVRQNENAA